MDLTPYRCRGFPGEFDRLMADVPVAGIDREQTHSMIRLAAETEPLLYGPTFSPRAIEYRAGSRPELEAIARGFDGSPRDRAWRALNWTRHHVVHPHFLPEPLPPDRAMTEEQLIASAAGWCNEQARVFAALCEVMGIPARLVFLFHADRQTGHVATEVFLDGRWAFHDVTYGVRVDLPDGSIAEARDLQGAHRDAAHRAYHPAMLAYYASANANANVKRLDPARGGDLFESLGLCNYLIDGVAPAGG